MIQIIKNKEGTKIKEFICDKKEDMADIDLRVCEMGTTCFVIEEDIIYILNSKKEWAIVENKLESAIDDVETSLTQLTDNTIHLDAQTLTEAQKAQVRSNIGIADGSGGDSIFWVTINTTTGPEILNAVANGQYPVIEYDETINNITYKWFLILSVLYTSNGSMVRAIFESNVGGDIRQVRLEGDMNWSVVVSDAVVQSINNMTGAVTISTATSSANGLMSSQDKSRLDALYEDYSSALMALGV